MKTRAHLLLAFLFCFLANSGAVNNVNGNGKVSTKKIQIEDFNEIRINSLMDFNYEQSDDQNTLEITLDENLHQYIDIDINNRVLTLGFVKKVSVGTMTKFLVRTNSKWLKKVKISSNANFMVNSRLTGDELEVKATDNSLVQFKKSIEVGSLNIDVAKSANVVMEAVKTDKLSCNMNGSGSIRIKDGSAKQGSFTTLSSGDIHAFGITVDDAKCKVAGSGLQEVNAAGNLNANLVGSGSIRYKGEAAVQQRILGKGTIEKAK